MALVTVQRSPSSTTSPQTDTTTGINITDEIDMGRNSKSLSECYFAGKGTALVLPAASEAQKASRRASAGSNIQKHLQSMFYLLRPEETLKMAVKLESVHANRTRYLVVVSRMGARAEESCLLGIDCNERTTVGMVLKVLADTAITLDGDGGFSVTVCGRHHIFKPVSVQAMWSALQTLHKASSKARDQNYFQGGTTHAWVHYYESRIESDRSCLNEWNAMDCLESRRAPSPDSARTKPTARAETERVIKCTLKEIMMSVDLDEVTSKYIRSRLEELFDMDLAEYKSFIDQEMLTILGQMDAPTEIFDHVYLGSEWNASNYEELQRNGVGHILNVTREIDNFFPGTFDYYNVRVYDDEKTDLLRHWDNTFKYITNAKREGSKVLVHCKMGVSRSASVVIAYAMKAYNWNFAQAMEHVKQKRNCIKPNTSFLSQLETYQGILDAMKNREKLQRSKSETNLKSPGLVAKNELILVGSEPTPIVKTMNVNLPRPVHAETISMSGQDLRQLGSRPKSWSPEGLVSEEVRQVPPSFRSLENLNQRNGEEQKELSISRDAPTNKVKLLKDAARNVLLPCDNGESYSVSPNQIMHIPNRNQDALIGLASVKERVNELEAAKKREKKKLVLNLFPHDQTDEGGTSKEAESKDIWDPGDQQQQKSNKTTATTHDCDFKSAKDAIKTSSDDVKGASSPPDMFSNHCDRVFDREERKQRAPTCNLTTDEEIPRNCPSRQSSWSSYDSAVGLNYQGETRDVPSRHSSWGSGDTRILPSRNSSWGSYDIRAGVASAAGAIPSNNGNSDLIAIESNAAGIFPGTVRRTKQKLEENSNVENTPAAINITTSPNTDGCLSRLSASAPEKSNMELMVSENANSLSRSASNIGSNIVSNAKNFLESLHKEGGRRDLDSEEPTTNPGMVQSLKKEFEAKNIVDAKVVQMNLTNSSMENSGVVTGDRRSVPSSPVLDKSEKPSSPTSSDPGENVKELRGKFEKSFNFKTPSPQPQQIHPHPHRYSCVEVSVEKSPVRIKQTPLITGFKLGLQEKSVESEFKRPPMIPVVRHAPNLIPSSPPAPPTLNNANRRQPQQQYGKSHPLAQLGINKQRHNNPVYNTM
ncbi:protein phosphatase Slingshot isoform X2 [Atheta coriaria]|uniref:protein phosphatase Slingshot isoform X2 n=1 Tax=Dalotia coriaria TaxID=877792 RepID=UPI0031F3D4F7